MKEIRFNLEAKNTLMSPSSLFPLELKGYPLVRISNFTAPSHHINYTNRNKNRVEDGLDACLQCGQVHVRVSNSVRGRLFVVLRARGLTETVLDFGSSEFQAIGYSERNIRNVVTFLIKPFKWITFQDKIRLIKD